MADRISMLPGACLCEPSFADEATAHPVLYRHENFSRFVGRGTLGSRHFDESPFRLVPIGRVERSTFSIQTTFVNSPEFGKNISCPRPLRGTPYTSSVVQGGIVLKKEYVRDGRNKIIGSITSGFSDESAVVRDDHEQIVGRTSERFGTTRDEHGGLVSTNSVHACLLIGRKK